MNEYEKLSVKAKQIKQRYPKGTRVELNSMRYDEPDPIPPFTRGTVVAVDDIGQILMQWDNGRTLSLIPGEDTFRKLSDIECFEEKTKKNFERFSTKVDRDIFPVIETEKLSGENKHAYIKEITEKLHALFVSVYGTDTVTPDYEYLEVPGIVRASGGEYFPALLGIDFGASGEHWRTCFITPHGIFDQDDEEPTTEQEQFLQSVMPYDVAWQVLNSADFGVPQSRKRVFGCCLQQLSACLGEERAGEILSFTESNPKTIIQKVGGRQGDRVYDQDGLSCTLTSSAGGFAGNTGLYSVGQLPIKSFTKSGYQIAEPGDSIDLAYPNLNSRRGRIGKQIAHTLTTSSTQGVYCIDMNPEPKITELARCITARQNSGIGNRRGEHSGVLEKSEERPCAFLNPERETVRQQGRRMKALKEPMFTLTTQDLHGIAEHDRIRKLTPLECWRLQGFTDEQFMKQRPPDSRMQGSIRWRAMRSAFRSLRLSGR